MISAIIHCLAWLERVEYVYALVEWDKKSKNKANIVESLLKVEGVLNVNLVEQTDDIGR